ADRRSVVGAARASLQRDAGGVDALLTLAVMENSRVGSRPGAARYAESAARAEALRVGPDTHGGDETGARRSRAARSRDRDGTRLAAQTGRDGLAPRHQLRAAERRAVAYGDGVGAASGDRDRLEAVGGEQVRRTAARGVYVDVVRIRHRDRLIAAGRVVVDAR